MEKNIREPLKRLFLLAIVFLGIIHFKKSYSQDLKSTAAPAIKTFTSQQDLAGIGSNSLNLYTGDVALPLNLISLPGHNGMDVTVSVSYTSNVKQVVDGWNLESPAGILGLGWSMDIPKIIADNKQTGTRQDDEFYLVLNGTSNPLIRTSSGSDVEGTYYTYETKSYQFCKIKFYYDPAEYGISGSGSNKWVIIREDGSKQILGDKNSSRSTIQWVVRWDNWIGNSALSTSQSQLANTWNLSEVVNVWNEKVTFEYENIDQYVGSYSGKQQTEASYLKSITDVSGRKVTFFYKDKQFGYYMEPHTEQAEPDAYQEFYEKKYLDHIDVSSTSGQKFLSVHFGYNIINTGTNAAKMLLTSIVQRNGNGNSLPGMKFSYYQNGATKGFLQTITFPTGGSLTYSYTEKSIIHSNREFQAVAPSGFAEPKVWLGEDYAVVAWRQLGAGGTHDDNPREVRLYVYQWVGEWKEQFEQTIGAINLAGAAFNKDYKDFQVKIERDFFAVLTRASPNTNFYHLFVRHKDPKNRGQWGSFSDTEDYGTDVPTLLSGTNFVGVGSAHDNVNYPSRLFTFQGTTFKEDIFDQVAGDYQYTSCNNYFISHKDGDGLIVTPAITFTYLTEDKKWVTKTLGNTVTFNSSQPSYWHSSNSMVVAMADNNPEFVFRWSADYNTFYRDGADKSNAPLFGELSDQAFVFMVNNSMIGIDGRIVRFDGTKWSSTSITSSIEFPYQTYFSYGDDYAIRPVQTPIAGKYKGGRKVFNPNTLNWENDVIMEGADAGSGASSAGIDYYYYGNGFYYRQPNGTWVKKNTYPSGGLGIRAATGWPRFNVMYGNNPGPVQEIRYFKNGELAGPFTLQGTNTITHPYKFVSPGAGFQTIVTYPAAWTTHEDATILNLNRLVDNDIAGYQKDYPVILITINDGSGDRYISFDYNITTATIDPNGTMAQYNEVTEIPGSSSSANRPFGFTKTFFHNGLNATELGTPGLATDLLWSGAPYKKEVYDRSYSLKSSGNTVFQTFSRSIQNNVGVNVQTGYYVRPVESRNMVDNIETSMLNSYDINTGLLKKSVVYNFDSKNGQAVTYYKYFWEQYDVSRTLNILSPVIEVKKSIFNGAVETFTAVSATTWKSWGGVQAPHKVYSWKRTGSPDFDFSAWSNSSEPSGNWFKMSEVNSLSNGDILQTTNN